VLPPAEIERAFNLGEQLRHVDVIFERVFGDAGAGNAGSEDPAYVAGSLDPTR
jgi:hypothetical protein